MIKAETSPKTNNHGILYIKYPPRNGFRCQPSFQFRILFFLILGKGKKKEK